MSAEGAAQSVAAKELSAFGPEETFVVFFHGLTDVATKCRPFRPKTRCRTNPKDHRFLLVAKDILRAELFQPSTAINADVPPKSLVR
jgi:hypothetical protein